MSLARRKEAAARALLDDRKQGATVWECAGFGVEFALKAIIAKKERFNEWPTAAAFPDLYTHNLRKLMVVAGVTLPANSVVAPHFATVLHWDRQHSYSANRVPRRVAKQMFEAAFGPDGVVAWISSTYQIS